MSTGDTSTEQIADLILRGEEQGWLALSEVERLGDGLPQKPLEAFYERLDAHGIEVRDDCGRAAMPLAGAGDALAPATANTLWLFLGEIPPFPPLSAAEELELAREVERGDRRSTERMINANLQLVASIAKRYEGRGLPLLDLIRTGIEGLVHAVETFDWRLGRLRDVVRPPGGAPPGASNGGTTGRVRARRLTGARRERRGEGARGDDGGSRLGVGQRRTSFVGRLATIAGAERSAGCSLNGRRRRSKPRQPRTR